MRCYIHTSHRLHSYVEKEKKDTMAQQMECLWIVMYQSGLKPREILCKWSNTERETEEKQSNSTAMLEFHQLVELKMHIF